MSPIVDRVRKLIALAGSPNEHESRSAAAMACRLIREHGLHVDDPSPHQHRADREAPHRRTQGPYARDRSTRGCLRRERRSAAPPRGLVVGFGSMMASRPETIIRPVFTVA
jgi:hypothetical protein